MTDADRMKALHGFVERVRHWSDHVAKEANPDEPMISIEIPVFKGSWLMPCVESVLHQSSSQWRLYLWWDGGDHLSRTILEILDALNSPKIKVFFAENQGIAKARQALSEASQEDYIMPVDDDDLLHPGAVESMLEMAVSKPWFGVIRARRKYIDGNGNFLDMEDWFPFEKRHYQYGMVQDLNNHCQPYLLSRRAYTQTTGWEGFDDFQQAGEDCDIYLKLEEKGSVELLDLPLYFYRLNDYRHSLKLTARGGYEMWRRLADKTIERIGLPLRRINEKPPFEYERLPVAPPDISQMDVVIAFYESDEQELDYVHRRVIASKEFRFIELDEQRSFSQTMPAAMAPCSRIELMCVLHKPFDGTLHIRFADPQTNEVVMEGKRTLKHKEGGKTGLTTINVPMENHRAPAAGMLSCTISCQPDNPADAHFSIVVQEDDQGNELASMRLFRNSPGYSRSMLDRCVASIKACGVTDDAIHIVNKKQSAAANRNEGYYRTTRPYVCFADDDIEVADLQALEKLLQIMHETDAAVIGPRLTTDIGTIFCADPYFAENMTPKPRGLGEPVGDQYRYIREVPWLPSTLIICRTEAIRAVGAFDEGYVGSQMEDTDFCLKVRQRDLKCVYAGTVDIVHYNHQRNDHFALNFERFAGRWGDYPELFTSIGDDADFFDAEE